MLEGAAAFVLYAAASVLLFGRGVVAEPTVRVVGDAGADKTIPLWSLVWWPHAIGSGRDPFDANVVWAPHGIDLGWVTAVPGPSLASYPLTAVAGPVVTYNVLALGAPALSAWSAYLLTRWITRSFWPSLVAGWLFGVSAYEVAHLVGHLNLVLTFLVPLCALLVLRHHAGEITSTRMVLLLGPALAAQLFISTEIALTQLLVGALFAFIAAVILDRQGRLALRRTVAATGVGVLLAAALASPLLLHVFVVAGGNAPIRSPFSESADVLNYVVPTHRIWAQPPGSASIAERFTATGAERNAYLGIPIVLAVLAYWRSGARRASRSILLWGVLALVVASFGPELRVAGHGVLPSIWKVAAKAPVTRTVIPARLCMYVSLVVAVIVAVWLSEGRRRPARWLLVVAGMATLLPNPATRLWAGAVPSPRFFATTAYRSQLRPDETVLVLPYGGAGWSLYWQAETDMGFRLVGGHLGRKVIRSERRWASVYDGLAGGNVPRDTFRRFLAAHRISAIVVAPGTRPRARRLVASLNVRPTSAADVLVYRLRCCETTTPATVTRQKESR